MTIYSLTASQVVPRSLEEVFAFFAAPENLARITPAWLRFRQVTAGSPPMAPGLRLEYRVSPFGVPQRWVSEITLWQPPYRFVDEQRIGPYRSWRHLHEFTAVPGGTMLHDAVRYELPFGRLGSWAHALVVRRQLRAIFRYRARAIEARFGQAGPALLT